MWVGSGLVLKQGGLCSQALTLSWPSCREVASGGVLSHPIDERHQRKYRAQEYRRLPSASREEVEELTVSRAQDAQGAEEKQGAVKQYTNCRGDAPKHPQRGSGF